MGKILIIVSIVLAAASAGVGFINRTNLLKTREELATSQQDASTTKASLKNQIKKYAEADKNLTELTARTSCRRRSDQAKNRPHGKRHSLPKHKPNSPKPKETSP
jgi:uncharacterized protein HemX